MAPKASTPCCQRQSSGDDRAAISRGGTVWSASSIRGPAAPLTFFLLANFKRATRTAASLLFDERRINRAFKIGDAFAYRAGCPLGHDARKRESGIDFVGVTSREGTLVALEAEITAARRDVDTAHLADDGI